MPASDLHQQAALMGAQCAAVTATLDALIAQLQAHRPDPANPLAQEVAEGAVQQAQATRASMQQLIDVLEKNFEDGGEGNTFRGRL
jgi:hypothetical protein